jgi:hypothetical protein
MVDIGISFPDKLDRKAMGAEQQMNAMAADRSPRFGLRTEGIKAVPDLFRKRVDIEGVVIPGFDCMRSDAGICGEYLPEMGKRGASSGNRIMRVKAQHQQPPHAPRMDLTHDILKQRVPVPHPDIYLDRSHRHVRCGALQCPLEGDRLCTGDLVDRRLPSDQGIGSSCLAGPQQGNKIGEGVLKECRTEPDDIAVGEEIEKERPDCRKRVRAAEIQQQDADRIFSALSRAQSWNPS